MGHEGQYLCTSCATWTMLSAMNLKVDFLETTCLIKKVSKYQYCLREASAHHCFVVMHCLSTQRWQVQCSHLHHDTRKYFVNRVYVVVNTFMQPIPKLSVLQYVPAL